MQKNRDLSFDAFRGVAIIAVVVIHAIRYGLSERYSRTDEWNFFFLVGWQQLFNFAIPAFLFISGYWISKKPIKSLGDYRAFLTRRLSRIFIPYLFWSVVLLGYAAIKTHNVDACQILRRLLTGGACVGYFFIIVIAQLYIITPFLQYINSKRYGPISVLIFNIISLLALYLSRVYHVIGHLPAALPFYSWIIFYEFGLLHGSHNRRGLSLKNVNTCRFILAAILVCLFISELEGVVLLSKYDNLEFAITSIKYSSFLYSGCIILGFLYIRERFRYQPKFLVTTGNYSFGIYLIHTPVLNQVAKFAKAHEAIYSFQPLYQFIIVALTLSICLVIIGITRRLLAHTFCRRVLGF